MNYKNTNEYFKPLSSKGKLQNKKKENHSSLWLSQSNVQGSIQNNGAKSTKFQWKEEATQENSANPDVIQK